MMFQINSKDMLAAVVAASAPISRSTVPVLECVLIRADGRLSISGTNMDTLVSAVCDASVTDPGAKAVNAVALQQFLKSIGDTALTVDVSDQATFSGGRAKLVLPFFDEDEFPQMMGADTPHEVEGGADAIAFCASFASTEDARYYLGGVHFSESGAVATDGRRMAICPVTSPITATVPNAAMRTISAVLKKGGRLFLGENAWRVESENIIARGKLVDGTFPDWQRIIPRGDVFVEFDADEMSDAINTATSGMAPNVFLRGAGDTISIAGYGVQNVEASAECPAIIHQDFAGAVNAKYLLSACAACAGNTVTVAGTGGALLVKPIGMDGYQVVVLGIRHADEDWPGAKVAA